MGIGLLRKIKELSVLRQEYMIHELGSGRVAFSPLLTAGSKGATAMTAVPIIC